MTNLIIGEGEVGRAIRNLFHCEFIDTVALHDTDLHYNAIRICYP